MSVPILRQLLATKTPDRRFVREIDNHYHAMMIAENGRQLVDYQRDMLGLQREAATSNLRRLSEVAARQDTANDLLGALLNGVSDLESSAVDMIDATSEQTMVLEQGFEAIAQHLLAQRQTLASIADTLARPYETGAREVLREATRAIESGMRTSGKESRAEYEDAMRLLAVVLDNPIGGRNYTAWFQIGWLAWKAECDVASAEEAFFNASRLSRDRGDLYHVDGLRHMAYMQYLQDKLGEAYDSIQRAIVLSPGSHDVLYDAARYAARTGREEEALSLLDKCIDLRPQTIVAMFSEEDFVC